MKAFTAVSLLGAAMSPAYAALAPRQSSAATQPVTVKGNAFYRGSERFYIRGVAYQPGGAADAKDPLLDIDTLKKDIVNFKSLGINTVRIYTIDNSKNHDEGMKLLADAGIYLALDANTPKYSLNRETAATVHRSYNEVYLQSVFATVDAFAEYPNTLLFFSGNEVINEPNNTNTAPYIKAVTRDMKQYIANRHSRIIPVGYSAADVASSIEQQALYFDCGTDDERADFFAFNDYSWCDSASALQTFKGAGWDKKVEMFKDFAKPIFLSEHGCIEDVRRWGEVGALYSTQMSAVYSGGLAYEYTVEPNKFGIVEVKNGQIETNADFDKLKDMYAKTKNPSGDGGAKTNGKAAQCPAESDDWEVQGTGLPALPAKAQKFMDSGAGTGPGLAGSGSHFAGEASKSTATPGSGNPTRTPNGEAVGSSGGQNAAAVVEIPLQFVAMLAASIIFGAALVF